MSSTLDPLRLKLTDQDVGGERVVFVQKQKEPHLREEWRYEDEEDVVEEEQDKKQCAYLQARQPHLSDHVDTAIPSHMTLESSFFVTKTNEST